MSAGQINLFQRDFYKALSLLPERDRATFAEIVVGGLKAFVDDAKAHMVLRASLDVVQEFHGHAAEPTARPFLVKR